MAKKTIYILSFILLLVSVFIFTGCDGSFGDVYNKDPALATPAATEDITVKTKSEGPKVSGTPVEIYTPTPKPTPTPTPTPEPTPIPTPEKLTYKKMGTKKNGTIKSLIYFENDKGYSPDSEHPVECLVDGKYDKTRWYHDNKDLDLELEVRFKNPVYIESIKILWFGVYKIYYYDMYVDVIGGESRVHVIDRNKNKEDDFTTDIINSGPTDNLRIAFHNNNNDNKAVSIYEFYTVSGFSISSEQFIIDEAKRTITIPGPMTFDEFFKNIDCVGSITAYLGTADGDTSLVEFNDVLKLTNVNVSAYYQILIDESLAVS